MGVFNNIQSALDTTLAGVSSIPHIVYQNVEYIPVQGTTYVRPTLLPANSPLLTISGAQKYAGIYQVDIFSPTGKGRGAALTIAENIKTAFIANNRTITAGSDKIWVLQVNIGKGERQDAWDHIFVEIYYNCIS